MTNKIIIQEALQSEIPTDSTFPWKVAVSELFNGKKFSSSHNMKLLWAKSIIAELPESPIFSEYLLYFQALTFLGRYSEGLKKINSLTFRVKKEVNMQKIIIENFKLLLDQDLNLKVNDLSQLCKNRDIVILGPKSEGSSYLRGALKVRFNVTSKEQAENSDIVYYNKYNFIKYKDEIIELLNDNEFFVVVNGFVPSRDGVDIPPEILKKIFSNTPFLLCFQSALLAVPRCINDMLSYGVKSIFITGVDLFTSYPFHSVGYNSSVAGMSKVINSWAIHDIFFNFSNLKRLFDLGLIDGDKSFSDIVQGDLNDYFHSINRCVEKTIEMEKEK